MNLEKTWKTGGVLLGIGLGGFFDGIVLHQILQWHHLVSEHYLPTSLQNLKINTLADGLFHLLTWVVTLLGLLYLWKGTRGEHQHFSSKKLVGALLAGWGGFNLVEGLIDHQILGIHHVRSGPDWLLYDVGFLIWGLLMLLLGLNWMRQKDFP